MEEPQPQKSSGRRTEKRKPDNSNEMIAEAENVDRLQVRQDQLLVRKPNT